MEKESGAFLKFFWHKKQFAMIFAPQIIDLRRLQGFLPQVITNSCRQGRKKKESIQFSIGKTDCIQRALKKAMFKKYNEEEQFGKPTAGFGFTVFIAISVFLHIVFIAFTFLLANDRSTIKITTPVYIVDLLAPERLMAPPEANAFKEQKPQTEVESKKDVSRPAVKEKAIALKKEKEPSLDEAIKKIQKRVEKRESEETISKAIQGMENRQVEKRIKEIKEKVAHRQIIARPIKAETKDAGSIQKGGAVKRIEELEGKYAQLVGGLIGEQWNYMGDIKKEEVIVISVRIDENGRLVESHIEQSSGNAALVQSAIKAIKKAASLFPPLPNELGKDFVEIGYIFQREKDN